MHAACARISSAERSGRSQKNRCPTPSRISSREPGISEAISRPFCDREQLIGGAVDHERRQSQLLPAARWCRARQCLHLRHDHRHGDRTPRGDREEARVCVASAAIAGETLISQAARSARSRSPDIIAAASRCSTVGRRQRAARAAAVGAAERQRANPLGMGERELLGDHAAHRDAEHVRGVELERASSPAASSAIWAIVIGPSRRRARADAAVVVDDHLEVARAAARGTARPSAGRCRSCP